MPSLGSLPRTRLRITSLFPPLHTWTNICIYTYKSESYLIYLSPVLTVSTALAQQISSPATMKRIMDKLRGKKLRGRSDASPHDRTTQGAVGQLTDSLSASK